MTPNGLGLDTANRNFGFEPIPAGTQAVLVMKIRPGNIGLEGLLKRSSNDKSDALDCEFTVLGGEYDGRKVFDWMNSQRQGDRTHDSRRNLPRKAQGDPRIGQRHRSERQLAGNDLAPSQCVAYCSQRCDVPRGTRDRARRQETGWWRVSR